MIKRVQTSLNCIHAHFGAVDNEAVVTSANGVDLYNFADCRRIESWSSGRDQLRVPAVQHPTSGLLYAVVSPNDRQLCCWDRTSKHMVHGSTQKNFPCRIVSLHVSAALRDRVILVHENGSISLLSGMLEAVCSCPAPVSQKKPRRQVVQSVLLTAQSGKEKGLKLLVFSQCEVGSVAQTGCDIFSVNEAVVTITGTHSFLPPALGSTFACAAYLDNVQRLVMLWSCCTMQVFRIDLSDIESATLQLSRQFNQIIDGTVSSRISLALSALGPSCVLIAGLVPSSKAFTANELTLTVWNVVYGTLQSEVPTNRPTLSGDLDDSDASHISVEYCSRRGSALLVSDRSCWTCALQPKQACLLHSLGRLRGGAERYLSEKNNVKSEIAASAEKMMSHTKTPNFESFITELKSYLRLSDNDNSLEIYSEPTGRSNLLPAGIVTTVVHRCLADHFWQPLGYIIRSGQVSARNVPELVPTLTSRAQLSLLDAVLMHVHDIPESTMVQLVSFFLAPDDATLSAMSNFRLQNGVASTNDFGTQGCASYFLCSILSRPRNDALLLRALRKLPVAQAVTLLEFSQRWLRENCISLSKESKKTNRVPTYAQILDWIMLILDAHFTSLLVIPACRTMLQDLAALITEHKDMAEKLTPLKGVLNHYQKHSVFSKQTTESVPTQSKRKHRTKSRGQEAKEKNSHGLPLPVNAKYSIEVFEMV